MPTHHCIIIKFQALTKAGSGERIITRLPITGGPDFYEPSFTSIRVSSVRFALTSHRTPAGS